MTEPRTDSTYATGGNEVSSGDHHLDNLARNLSEQSATVRDDVRGAAWNYLARLDYHRTEFHQDKCPERGDFPRWYRDKAADYEIVCAAEARLRDALAQNAIKDYADPCRICFR